MRNHKGDWRQIQPTAAHILREFRGRSVHLRRPAQHSGTEGNPRRKTPPAAFRNYFLIRRCVEFI